MARICVYCASSVAVEPFFLELATAVGTELARCGHDLVSGGGRVSMMGAVAVAARAGGARTTGVIPQRLVDWEVADTDADELIVVDTMRERKRLMDENSDAFLVLPGGIGTLEEMFEVWTARTLGLHAKPVVVLDPTGHFADLWAALTAMISTGFVRAAAFDALVLARTVEDAVAACAAPVPGSERGGGGGGTAGRATI